ncbi:MAG: 4Fe-4S dicluster domain-containing protein [Clostridia bacterium]|nr:4Fe-4S dicluster domain-containing protein [Clostridia bacterium]
MELKEIMKNAGIVGAGGAGFPSYAKLADGADMLVVNGAECEPLLYTDFVLLQKEMPLVLSGIKAVLEYAKIPCALLCVKEHTAVRLKLKDGTKLADRIILKTLPDVYPMGDEISLIYQATGRVVKPGNLPITAGVIVLNVETLYNVARAVKGGDCVTEKYLTIGGDIPQAIVVKVPIGTSVAELFEKNSIEIPEGYTVLDGGPSMGKVIDPERAVVTKTTKGLLILPNTCEAVLSKYLDGEKSIARAETACCQCTRCTDMCPRHLLGYPLEPHKMVRTAKSAVSVMPEMVISATLCCGCGICETLACCQGISPKAVINEYKSLLAKNKMRYIGKEEVSPAIERDWRMVPSERWANVLGVAKYDKLAKYVGTQTYDRVEILLRQHIGAPSVPCVSDGDFVQKGDKIAEAAEGLSLPQYASVSGRVTVFDGEKIVIEKVSE